VHHRFDIHHRLWCHTHIPVVAPGQYVYVLAFARFQCTLSAFEEPHSPSGPSLDERKAVAIFLTPLQPTAQSLGDCALTRSAAALNVGEACDPVGPDSHSGAIDMKLARAFILATFLGLAGCPATPTHVETANQQMEAKGSPFRYVAQGDSAMVLTLMPLPTGPTRAVAPLAAQALDAITAEERRKGRSTATLEEVRYLQDGREVWVLRTLGSGGIAYVVSFAAPSQTGSDIRMTGPHTYSK
jgi:hypothetical protein